MVEEFGLKIIHQTKVHHFTWYCLLLSRITLTIRSWNCDKMNKKIFVVDDEYDLTMLFGLSLRHKGFDVDTFTDPIHALSKFKPNYYSLALLDIKMAEMDGFELFRNIRQIDSDIKVIFLTASESYYEEYRRSVFTDFNNDLFLQKPIEITELLKKIEKMLG